MGTDSESLRDIAIKIVKDQQESEETKGPNERSIFILGSKSCGKSTILNQLLERNEAVRPTLALDYSFLRKTSHAGQNIRRQVCHLWELGGASRTTSEMLIKVPFMASSNQTIIPATAVLMLDMSKPKNVWSDLEETLACLKLALAVEINKGSKDSYYLYQNRTENQIPTDHPDLVTLNPFPIPLIILGGKYDVFQDHEPEIKKRICRTLRSCSHLLGATLVFYSQSEPALIKRVKQILNDVAFGRPNNAPVKGICTDYNQPLFVPTGYDTWSNIGTEPLSLPAISMSHSQWFPNESSIAVVQDDPAADPAFREDELDAARSLATHRIMIDLL